MGKYNAYEKYKDSGVEWLGEIPEHWEVKRIKFIGKIKYGLGEPPEKLDDGLPIIRATDIYRGVIDGSKVQRVNPEKVPWSRNPELKTGDILVVRSGAYTGDSAIVPNEWAGSIAGYDMVLTPTQAHPKYIAWNLLGRHILEGQLYLAKSRAAQPHLNAEELGNTIITTPPLPEQQAIANFLDYKTKQIDALINKKETLLEKLNEKRTAIISHAVTKGLDPNVPMKDSGIEWLGEIPEHWQVKRTKFLVTKIGSGKTPKGGSEIYVDSGVMLIRSQNVYDNGLRLDDIVYIDKEIDNIQANSRVFPNDILLNITGASIGRVSLVPHDFGQANVNQHVCILRPICCRILPQYLHLVLCSKQGKEQIFSYENGTSREGLTFQQAGNLTFPVPPINEQKQITQYLDKKTTEIDQQKAKIQQAIDRLKEYRTALITNAVTGKIDVRQVPIP